MHFFSEIAFHCLYTVLSLFQQVSEKDSECYSHWSNGVSQTTQQPLDRAYTRLPTFHTHSAP